MPQTENEIDIKAAEDAEKKVSEKAEAVEKNENPSPAVTPVSAEVSFDEPAKKENTSLRKLATNDGTLVLSELDDKTNVSPGNVMENQAREPAHQQHELDIEEDAPGFEQSAALMLPRGSAHYTEGGSNAEVAAGKSFGEA